MSAQKVDGFSTERQVSDDLRDEGCSINVVLAVRRAL
jgi:hypothetical protein